MFKEENTIFCEASYDENMPIKNMQTPVTQTSVLWVKTH